VKELCDLLQFQNSNHFGRIVPKRKICQESPDRHQKIDKNPRNKGVEKGKIVNADADEKAVIEELKATQFPTNQVEQFLQNILCKSGKRFQSGFGRFWFQIGNHSRVVSKKL
jgi:hypothetical protein